MPKREFNSWKSSDSNCRPWSVVTRSGTPNLTTHVEMKRMATVAESMSCSENASGHLVNRSTDVRQYLKPREDGSGPTRSICTCLNRIEGVTNSATGAEVCLETLECWQGMQVRKFSVTKGLTLGIETYVFRHMYVFKLQSML